MVYFINRKAHWILWLGQTVSMRQLGAKRKKKKQQTSAKRLHVPNGKLEHVQRNNRLVNATLLLLGKFLNGKNLFNDQVKENTCPF